MYYKLLGMAVWHGGKFLIRQRYGVKLSKKPLVAGAAMATVAGVGLAVAGARRTASSD